MIFSNSTRETLYINFVLCILTVERCANRFQADRIFPIVDESLSSSDVLRSKVELVTELKSATAETIESCHPLHRKMGAV